MREGTCIRLLEAAALSDPPSSIQPVGSQIDSGVSVAGYSWNLWSGPNSNWQTISFVSADGNINDFSADLNEFFRTSPHYIIDVPHCSP